jgi:hypothetical protein
MLLSTAWAMARQLGLSIGLAVAVPAVSPTTAGVANVADSSAAAIALLSTVGFPMMFLLCLLARRLVRWALDGINHRGRGFGRRWAFVKCPGQGQEDGAGYAGSDA